MMRFESSLASHWKHGDRVFVSGLTGESSALREELLRRPELATGIDFTCVQLPSVDQTDYLAFDPSSRTSGFFFMPRMRDALAKGRCSLYPLDYIGISRYLAEAPPFDVAFGQFTPPDADGWCTPGLTADFLPLVWAGARKRVGHINPALPRLSSSFRVHVTAMDAAIECPAPVLEVKSARGGAVSEKIAQLAATLVCDGDTLQLGIGSVIPEVAHALCEHRHLRIYSGMVAPWVRTLWESQALDYDAMIVTGVVFGDTEFYQYAQDLGRIHLADVRETHSLVSIAQHSRFVAINGAVEVDLFGQVNSERSDGSLQAGAGGLPAYAQASQLSSRGRLLICLPSTARGGTISRIVPAIEARGLCTLPRYLADVVITEFGIAELRGLTLEQRARALIAIAHPDHRDRLSVDWEHISSRL